MEKTGNDLYDQIHVDAMPIPESEEDKINNKKFVAFRLEVSRAVTKLEPELFNKVLDFFAFILKEKNLFNVAKIVKEKHMKEFVECYEFFLNNNKGTGDISKYFEDFKKFFHGQYIQELEQIENDNYVIETLKTNWFRGIMDSFNQEPNDNDFWNNDEYFKGYQRGTEIFRTLMLESKVLFPQIKIPENKFIESQKQLFEIIKKIDLKR